MSYEQIMGRGKRRPVEKLYCPSGHPVRLRTHEDSTVKPGYFAECLICEEDYYLSQLTAGK